MIGRLAGIVLHKAPPQVLLDVHGVGYEVDVPMSTFFNLPGIGESCTLLTHFVVREDGHFLFGFATEAERFAFRQLVKISGVGARTALSLLSGLSVADLVNVSSEPAVHLVDAPEIPTLWHGPLGGTARLLAGTTGPDMIELWQWEMAPGERFDSDGHTTGTVELFHVEQGILTIGVDGDQWQVKAGQSLVARTDVPHHYANNAETLLRFTMTVAELTAR